MDILKPQYYFPVKPHIITRYWGELVIDPITKLSIYLRFGFKLHNGVDVLPAKVDKIYRYPWNGTGKVVKTGYQPNGGGIFVGLISNENFEFPDGKVSLILTDALHAEKILVKVGDIVNTGDALIIQDSTGFSTGNHTHGQYRRETWDGIAFSDVDRNEANNSFDPMVYAVGKFAVDELILSKQLQAIKLLKEWISQLWTKLNKQHPIL